MTQAAAENPFHPKRKRPSRALICALTAVLAIALYVALPSQLGELPQTLRRLEADAQAVRARIEELNALLTEAAEGRTTAAADRRAALRDRLEHEREKAEAQLRDAVTALEGAIPGQVPSEMVTASGAGLDPHIPPAAADLQAARVARARNVPVERVREVVRSLTESPTFGFLGRSRVNVLELNLALDQSLGTAPTSRAAPAAAH